MKKISLVREELRLKEHMKSINIFVITFERKLFNVILFQTREMAESHFCVVFFFLGARPPKNTIWMNCTLE